MRTGDADTVDPELKETIEVITTRSFYRCAARMANSQDCELEPAAAKHMLPNAT